MAIDNDRQLAVVIIPNKIQVENSGDLTNSFYEAEKPNRLIMEYCAKNGMRCLDLLPPLRSRYESSGEPLYYPVDRHFNQRGNVEASQLIFEFARELS